MAQGNGKSDPNYKVIAENRRARYDYAIEDDLECGIMLEGSEVKSLREGGSNIAESYATVEDGELWLVNGYIAPYKQARQFKHEERRRRKLLVSRKELANLWSATNRKGMTLVPLVMYFNHRGMVKLKIGIAKGKKNHDKRASDAKRDWGPETTPLAPRRLSCPNMGKRCGISHSDIFSLCASLPPPKQSELLGF